MFCCHDDGFARPWIRHTERFVWRMKFSYILYSCSMSFFLSRPSGSSNLFVTLFTRQVFSATTQSMQLPHTGILLLGRDNPLREKNPHPPPVRNVGYAPHFVGHFRKKINFKFCIEMKLNPPAHLPWLFKPKHNNFTDSIKNSFEVEENYGFFSFPFNTLSQIMNQFSAS